MATHTFKTLYFPGDRVASGRPTRVTISLPLEPCDSVPPGFVEFVATLSSAEIRAALGDPLLEEMEERARAQGRSFSNACIRQLVEIFQRSTRGANQLALPFHTNGNRVIGVTFQESKRLAVHSWYPYVEGYSAPYVREVLDRYADPAPIYDPFGGAGTTQLTASMAGIPSLYSEINPFMAFVADTKVESARWARRHLAKTETSFSTFLERLGTELSAWADKADLAPYESAFPGRDFFEEKHLRHLLGARDLAVDVANGNRHLRALLLLACAANAVRSSNMTRRADLRRRRADEYKTRQVDVASFVRASLQRMLADIRVHPPDAAPTSRISGDCRDATTNHHGTVGLAITSPPYLNGTNYFRNTKIELWLLGFIQSERDLTAFRAQAVAAGINNISRERAAYDAYPPVEAVASRLDECAGDRRIPLLVRHYFSDMAKALKSVYALLKPGGRFALDIGDSKFYGVHVPTDQLIERIGEDVGFRVESSVVLARRYSRDKSDLVQREIVFLKPATRGMKP